MGPWEGETMRAALAVITYPPDGDQHGLESLIGDWGPQQFADYIAATQVIFEALTIEFGAGPVGQIINRLRAQSFENN